MAWPPAAGLVALIVYLWRATLSSSGLDRRPHAYFNFLADAFLHGQLHLRLPPPTAHDLVLYDGKLYLYWPPFPSILVAPLVALFGVGVSDVVYTVVIAAFSVALVAWLLRALHQTGVAPLDPERRGLLVLTVAFGSVLLILAPVGQVWFTGQVIGWACMLLAVIAALTRPGIGGYALAGLALAAATTTRLPLLFSGLWLAFYLLWRDWHRPLRWRLQAALAGVAPIVGALALLGLYNAARFGNPLETGLAWHNMGPLFREPFARYGAFDLHYLPTNLYYQFIAYPFLPGADWTQGGGIFWLTPVFLAAFGAVWRGRRDSLVWSLVLTCVVLYIPIGLLMGTGWITFGPRYLLDLTVPLLVLTARGVARWPRPLLAVLAIISCLTYGVGSYYWLTRF